MVDQTQLNVPQSDSSGPEGNNTQMPGGNVGALLKASRERLGYDLDPLAESLRIRRIYLEAIEDGHYDRLPGNAYAVGFIRSYAEQLGLDGNELADRFKDEIGVVRAPVPKHVATPEPMKSRGGLPIGPILMSLSIAAAAGFGGWYYITVKDQAEMMPSIPASLHEKVSDAPLLSGEDKNSEEPPKAAEVKKPEPKSEEPPKVAEVKKPEPKPAEPPKVAEVKKPEPKPVEPPKVAVVKKPEPKPAEPPKVAEVKKPEPKSEEPPKVAEVKKPESKAEVQKTEEPKKVVNKMRPKPIPVVINSDGSRTYGSVEGGTSVELVATADTWVQVTEGETLLLTRVLHPGDRFIAPKREGLKLMTGNAGGLELKVDNKVMRSLGEQGKVLRDVSLDAKALQQQFSQ